ncbi:hypothetical protein [Spartinivicinus poritis]|uniref:Phage abortive infection protein n=1 Tax=Spartinivicinus poritis TaxID=2994640 RepID=A0ABT5UGD8_9GAMM|nr:hypothetical protein [Spartinivicinus sp. A2-2]MDE1465455.1 hypothetical protein [Spartinivicinus sp. A2-2]
MVASNLQQVVIKSFMAKTSTKAVTFIIIIIALTISINIYLNENLSFTPTAQGFTDLIDTFKVPLGVLSLLIPTLGIMAVHHRSIQSAEQIRIIEEQRIFSNYFKHFEMFEKHLDNIENIHFDSKTALYELFYPHSKAGDLSIDINLKGAVDELIKETITNLKQLNTNEDPSQRSFFTAFEQVESNLQKIEEVTAIEHSDRRKYKTILDDCPLAFKGLDAKETGLIAYFTTAHNYLSQVNLLFKFEFGCIPKTLYNSEIEELLNKGALPKEDYKNLVGKLR